MPPEPTDSEWKTRVTPIRRPAVTEQPAVLVLIYPEGPGIGTLFQLERARTFIGRGSDCDIVLEEDSVSRRHARIELRPDSITVTDLESTNGTYVNERQVMGTQVLANGDLVQIGNTIFKFFSGGNIEAEYHEVIYRMTIIDGLTGAYNKRYLMELLDRELARFERYGRPLSVAVFDLDHFKKINDTHGHLTGDHVLRELARRIQGRIRKEEVFARYGGEEFVVFLPEAGHQGAMEFAEQLRTLVEATPFEFEGQVIPVTISVGVATIQGGAKNASIETSTFLKVADDNLYRAKRQGRNCVVGEILRTAQR